MGSKTTRSVILISIHPQYADAIREGRKHVELRKTRFKEEPEIVVLYVTSPLQKVIGYFEVNKVNYLDTNEIWKRFRKKTGVTEDTFWSYYGDSEEGAVIQIGSCVFFDEPLPLAKLSLRIRPPQNFMYLTANEFENLKSK